MEEAFDRFWKSYPVRLGSRGKSEAKKRFLKIIGLGENVDVVINGAKQYAKYCDAHRKTGTEFVCMAVTWLNQRRWEDYETQERPTMAADQEAELLERYRRRRIREGWDNGKTTET